MVDGNKLNAVLEFTYLGSTMSSNGCIDVKYRRMAKVVHLSADYARDSGTTTMCPCGLKARYTVQSCCPPSNTERSLDSVQTTVEKAACLHDATSAFDHEDNLDGQSDKQGHTRADRAAIYGRSSDQKGSPVDWPPHEDVTRHATKADSLLPTVFWSQKERAPSSLGLIVVSLGL
ncbi:hypothetical protein NP493_106g01008 [Ridgeia piscesae]|uniref:Uncharacterized protein n=1 Tax=Ridgeia piscesae TaxID=27915 RepID=A0AAD9UH89_RIDPI|nr:hypothetical protein NP493_106g01008 [Ridgeia piscesae]